MIDSSALLKIEWVGVRVGTRNITTTIWQRLFMGYFGLIFAP